MVFKARLDYGDLGYLLKGWQATDIMNNQLNDRLRELANQAEPSFEDEYDRVWQDFYLPVERDSQVITIPFRIDEYLGNGNISAVFPSQASILCLRRETNDDCEHNQFIDEYKAIIDEAISFVPLLKEKGEEALNVPFDIRLGKVKAKYVLEDTIPEEEREEILKRYEEREYRTISKISLADYFRTAAICYRAAFPKGTKGLSPTEMYDRFAHSNHRIFPIDNPTNESEFDEWLKSGRPGHAFWFAFRTAHLYPPSNPKQVYRLSSSELRRSDNLEQAQSYLKMVSALIDARIPFEADLDEVLDYLSGETEFSVKIGERPIYHYEDTPENRIKIFPHIKWDPLKIPKWK